ncbi:signal recognition particle 14kD protein-domain-containing protein [Melampsora americana]|nr:signal recognition particle 14kD protein-domain-containing protein [Melampsora americana]
MSDSNSEFLTKLTELFKKDPTHTVFLTQKRFTHQIEPSNQETQLYPCLIRATDGHKIKFSTLVKSEELSSFYDQYSKLIRTSLNQSLIPKKSKKSTTSTLKVKKKFNSLKPFQSLPFVFGKKRGAGVEKRRKLIKDRLKILHSIRKRLISKIVLDKKINHHPHHSN